MPNKGHVVQLGDFSEHERLDLRVKGRLIRLNGHRADTANNCQRTEHFNMTGHSLTNTSFMHLSEMSTPTEPDITGNGIACVISTHFHSVGIMLTKGFS